MWRILSVLLLSTHSNSARILGIFPAPFISHQVVFRPLMKELARRGHDLTVLTPNPVNYLDVNFTQIDVHDESYKIKKEFINYVDLKMNHRWTVETFTLFYDMTLKLTEMQIVHPEMQKMLNNNESFDVCFFETLVPSMYSLKDRFGCRMILISSLPGTISNYESMGMPTDPTIYPNCYYEYHEGDLSLLERLYAIYDHLRFKQIYYWTYVPKFDKLAERLLGDVRSAVDIERDADMFFINANPVLSGIRPIPPSVIYLGSMNINPPKQLDKEYQSLLDGAKNGAVYFSFGSNVKCVDLPVEVRESFVQAFKELPYTILMKWENDTLPSKPPNVHIFKWMPQQDILAHPNVRAFITQGGQQSLEEAIDRKVPLIVLPFIADQPFNAERISKLGIGIKLSHDTLDKEIVKHSVYEIINNPSYKERISVVRDIIEDEPQTPIERAVWWTEYVLRHKGAHHFKSPAVHVPFFKYYYLDIFALILACILTSICLLIITIIIISSMFKVPNVNFNIKKFQ